MTSRLITSNEFDLVIECNDHDNVQLHVDGIFNELKLGGYNTHSVKDKDVLDIGAYCGETACYFSRNGARRVIAVEPLNSFEYIERNAIRNGCRNIVPYRAAIGAEIRKIVVDEDFWNTGSTQLSMVTIPDDVNAVEVLDTKDGSKYVRKIRPVVVQVVTIEKCCNEFDLHDAVMKLDCEGGEYEAIPATSRETLRRFEFIFMETHKHIHRDVNEVIADKLIDCGFNVGVAHTNKINSMLYAKRVD